MSRAGETTRRAAGGLEVAIEGKAFPARDGTPAVPVLGRIRFAAAHGTLVCLTGPSGCGKTTLLNILAGLDPDYGGRVSLPTVTGRAAPAIGYVFQSPRLLPWRTVEENIRLAPGAAGEDDLVEALLAATGLADARDVYPQRLSLGMARRVAIARAFAVRPDLLLMDEPFVSLDAATAARLRRLLVDVWRRHPTTVLFVTHDLREAIELGRRLIVLGGAPAVVRAEIDIALPESARLDEGAVEAERLRLLAAEPALSS